MEDEIIRLQHQLTDVLMFAQSSSGLVTIAMDWLRQSIGHANIAVWHVDEQQKYHYLAGYLKHTVCDNEVPMSGIVPYLLECDLQYTAFKEVVFRGTGMPVGWTKAFPKMRNQRMLAARCDFLSDTIAVVAMFRKPFAYGSPAFTERQQQIFQMFIPIFTPALWSMLEREAEEAEEALNEASENQDDGVLMDDDDTEEPRPGRKDKADWWKRGEPPPF